jgi:hypothetical protein
MPFYQIQCIKSGVVLGRYEAADEQGARDTMARGAGYNDEAHAAEASGEDGSHVRVSEVERG